MNNSGKVSERLSSKKEKILQIWEKRYIEEVRSAGKVPRVVLRDSVPVYLEHLSEALANNKKTDFRSVFDHEKESGRIGKLHGSDRAQSGHYDLSEVIFEYHLLRETIFQVLENEGPLEASNRDIILDSMEQAVNDAAVEFSDFHAEIQDKFVNTLTHDLKSPITTAKLSAQLLLRRSDIPAPALDTSKRILGSMNRLESMIQDLLDASRVRAGEMLEIKYSECDLEEIAHEVIEEMSFVHGDRFTFDSQEKLEGSWARDGLRRVLENLLGNAVKYSTPQSQITLTLKRLKDSAVIDVHNFGKPIAAEEIPTLFHQFRRAKTSQPTGNHAPTMSGWGLGLTLVKGVMEACGGTVKVESSETKGTHFNLQIPEYKPEK